MTGSTIYNSTDGPLTIDRAGRQLGGRERLEDVADTSTSPLSGHIAAGRIIVLEQADEPQPEQPQDEQTQTTTSKRARKSAASTQEA